MKTTAIVPLVLLAFAVAAAAPAQTVNLPCTTHGTNCRNQIPDRNGVADGVLTSVITVPAGTCTGQNVGHVRASVRVTHDWLGDLNVRLIGPTAATATLFTGEPASNQEDFNAVFDDWATVYFFNFNGDGYNGALRPVTSLSVFEGAASPAGAWTLEITDRAANRIGALEGWTLGIICGVATAPPVVTIEATDPNASEQPLNTGTFVISRANAEPSPLVVTLQVSGTALPGSDYVALPSTVTIPAGEASVTLTLTPLANAVAEPAEWVTVTVVGRFPDYVAGTPSSATVTIVDQAPLEEIPALGGAGLAALALLLALLGGAVLRARG